MIQHEITLIKFNKCLKTLNRDLKKHREGDLPALRSWCENGTLTREFYHLNGKWHLEDGPAYRTWFDNGILGKVIYYRNAKKQWVCENYDPT
jgi:hypothetical protein